MSAILYRLPFPGMAPEDRLNIEFAHFLLEQQQRVRPRLSQAEWAREAKVSTTYLNRLLRAPELIAEDNPNRSKRPRADVAMKVLKVLEGYLRETGIVESGLRMLGYDPSIYLLLDSGDIGEAEMEGVRLGLRIVKLPDEDRQVIEQMVERMEAAQKR